MRPNLFGIAIATILTTGAHAADLPLKAPPMVSIWTWTGFYAGGNVGVSFGHASTDFAESSTTTAVVTATTTGGLPVAGNGATATAASSGFGSAGSDLIGWLGGAQIGYNWQIQQWVLGLEADIQATSEQDDPTFCSLAGCPAGSLIATSTTKLPWFGTVRGRVGYSWNYAPNRPVLFYLTGGLAYGEVDANYTGGLVGGPVGAVSVKSTRTGWTAGGGGEARLGDSNWTFKVEYLYIDFGNVSGATGGTTSAVTFFGINNSDFIHFITTTTSIAGTATTHVTDQLVRVGFNYKFPPH